MAKTPPITSVVSGFTSANTLNANFQALKDAFNNTVSLDGSTPNAMQAELDLGDNNIINAANIEADGFILNGVPLTVSNVGGATLQNLSAFGADLVAEIDAAGALTQLGLTATAAELNTMDGITATTAELNTLDGITATTAELNIMDGVTATAAEINYVDGVTSDIQTQINAKYTPTTQTTATWEAGTSTTESLVSPAKLAAAVTDLSPSPPLSIVAYAECSNVGTNPVSTNQKYGFGTITRTSQGQYTFNFSSARPNNDYIVLCQSTGGTISRTASVNTKGTSSFDVDVRVISSGGTTDQTFDCIVFQ